MCGNSGATDVQRSEVKADKPRFQTCLEGIYILLLPMSGDTCVTVTRQAALPDRGGVLKDVSTVLEGSTLPESSDPLDFFGAIRDLVERGLTEQERAILHSTEKQDHQVVFPKANSELSSEKEKLKQRVEDLELELKQYRERSTTVRILRCSCDLSSELATLGKDLSYRLSTSAM